MAQAPETRLALRFGRQIEVLPSVTMTGSHRAWRRVFGFRRPSQPAVDSQTAEPTAAPRMLWVGAFRALPAYMDAGRVELRCAYSKRK